MELEHQTNSVTIVEEEEEKEEEEEEEEEEWGQGEERVEWQ